MVKHHILIGLGFKKQNFRNRGFRYMLSSKRGSALPQNQMTIMPVNRPPPKIGGAVARRPLKFNY
jgi:hypothetical protein